MSVCTIAASAVHATFLSNHCRKGWRWKVTDDQVVAIHEMKEAGKPVAQIARVTGLSRPTVYRVLGNGDTE